MGGQKAGAVMFRTKFEEKLESVVIPQDTPQDELGKMCQKLDRYVAEKLPTFLYKFRCCNERHIDAFYHNQVWISNAELMNDGYDTRLYFERSAVEKFLKEVTSQNIKTAIDTLCAKNVQLPDEWRNIPEL